MEIKYLESTILNSDTKAGNVWFIWLLVSTIKLLTLFGSDITHDHAIRNDFLGIIFIQERGLL